jgi:hypothetical protein
MKSKSFRLVTDTYDFCAASRLNCFCASSEIAAA